MELGLSQPECARRLGVGLSSISNWERDAYPPDPKRLGTGQPAYFGAGHSVVHISRGWNSGSNQRNWIESRLALSETAGIVMRDCGIATESRFRTNASKGAW